jgi:hypothetical protein
MKHHVGMFNCGQVVSLERVKDPRLKEPSENNAGQRGGQGELSQFTPGEGKRNLKTVCQRPCMNSVGSVVDDHTLILFPVVPQGTPHETT